MANQFLKLRRSAVPGRIPSTSSLDFGEIALNTYDGLAFLKKSGSAGEEIVTIGADTTNITGSDSYIPIFSGSNALQASSIYQRDGFTSIRNSTGPIDPSNPDVLYVDGTDLNTYNLISAHNTLDSYTQINIQNFSAGNDASADIVATNDIGDEESYYINMGINSSGYQPSSLVGVANDAYLYSTANDLYIGNATAGKQVIIFNGGTDAGGNARVWIHDQGTVGINTSNYNADNPPSLQVQAPNNTTYNLIQAVGNVDNYSQVGIVNANAGATASADLALYNNIDPINQLAGFVDLGINSTNYVYNGFYPGTAGDAYLFTDSHHLVLGSTSGSGNTRVTIFAGGVNEAENSKLILFGNNQHQMSGSLNMSGSLTVGGTITAQTLIVQTITSSIDFVTGSTRFGSQLSNTHQFTGSVSITGSLNAPIITGSLFGTASWAQNAVTASYVAAANVVGLSLFQIATGSITASVGLGNDLFLIKSGSKTYFNISSSGDTTIYSSNFMIRDFNTNEMVFQVSASRAYFDFDGITIATQSVAPTGSADVGGILFTSTAMYIGLN
jgi:hypothetical protein